MTPDQEEVVTVIMRERMQLIKMLRRLTHPNADDSDLEDALSLLEKYEA